MNKMEWRFDMEAAPEGDKVLIDTGWRIELATVKNGKFMVDHWQGDDEENPIAWIPIVPHEGARKAHGDEMDRQRKLYREQNPDAKPWNRAFDYLTGEPE